MTTTTDIRRLPDRPSREASETGQNRTASQHHSSPYGDCPGSSTPDRSVRCRYVTERFNDRCPNEAVDSDGEILLCIKHLGRALELFRRRAGGQ